MKKMVFIALLLGLVMALTAGAALADTVYTNGGTHYIISAEGEITITEYFGKDESVTIPARIGNYPVTAIASGAFVGTTVRELTLPQGIDLPADAVDENVTVTFAGEDVTPVVPDEPGDDPADPDDPATPDTPDDDPDTPGDDPDPTGGKTDPAEPDPADGDTDPTPSPAPTAAPSPTSVPTAAFIVTPEGSTPVTPQADGSYVDDEGGVYHRDAEGNVLDETDTVLEGAVLVEEEEGSLVDRSDDTLATGDESLSVPASAADEPAETAAGGSRTVFILAAAALLALAGLAFALYKKKK